MLYPLSTSLPFALGIAVSPIPVVAIVSILSVKPGNALPFTIGWILGLLTIGIIVFLIPGLETMQDEPTILSGWIRIGIGAVLAVMAGYKGFKRSGEEAEPSKIIRRIDSAPPSGIFGLGVILTALNPKAIALTFAGAANLDAYSAGWVQQTVAFGFFILVASLTVVSPIILQMWFPVRSATLLEYLTSWLNRYNNVLSAAVLALFSILLVANGARIVF